MIATSQQQPFTAELRRRSMDAASAADGSDCPSSADEVALWHAEVLQAMVEIRQSLSALVSPAPAPAAPAPAAPTPRAEEPNGGETRALKRELQALEQAIAETKREIAALRQAGKPPAALANTTDELDAVVRATESATECILATSERIDEIVGCLRNQAADAEERASVDEIGELVTRIFEACNFQDITGQRIDKVVSAMRFIEERVERMIEILGGSAAFADLASEEPSAPEQAPDDDRHLLAGPQLDEHKISQDDIDAFFK